MFVVSRKDALCISVQVCDATKLNSCSIGWLIKNTCFHAKHVQLFYDFKRYSFNSFASEGCIFPPSINRTCLLRKAPSYKRFSSSVSGINSGTLRGLPFGSSATKVKYASLLSYLY